MTASGGFAKSISQSLSGAVTGAGSLANHRTQPLSTSGSVLSTGGLDVQKLADSLPVSGAVTSSGSLARRSANTLSGSSHPYGLLYGNGVLLDSNSNPLLLLGV
jgi:hypothetical protein